MLNYFCVPKSLLLIVSFLALLLKVPTFAQTTKPDSFHENNGKFGLSFGTSTLGFGGSCNISLAKAFKIKAGYHSLETSLATSTKFGSDYVSLNIKPQLQNFSLISEIYPSQKSSFHFLLGVIYSNSQYRAIATPRDSQSHGFINFPPENVGEIEIRLVPEKIQPLVGLGFGRSIPKKRLGFSLEGGLIYSGPLNASLEASNSLEPSANESNSQIIKNAFSDFTFFPYIDFKINFKLF